MGESDRKGEFSGAASEGREAWDRNAAFWNERMGEGNDWHRDLIAPATQRLLDLKPGQTILDIACGNGLFARSLARKGMQVVAFDYSEKMIELAKANSDEVNSRIEYRVLDATKHDDLLALGKERFNAAVANMALMDISEIEPLLNALRQLLKKDGRFVFSVCHPCFNSTRTDFYHESRQIEGRQVESYGLKVSGYLSPQRSKGAAIHGQPALQDYFERPLSVILGTCFSCGFVLDGLEEPSFGEGAEAKSLRWDGRFQEIPPVLVARLRLR